jgi:hypothetical protein
LPAETQVAVTTTPRVGGEWKDVRKAAAPTLFALFVVGRADSIP